MGDLQNCPGKDFVKMSLTQFYTSYTQHDLHGRAGDCGNVRLPRYDGLQKGNGFPEQKQSIKTPPSGTKEA